MKNHDPSRRKQHTTQQNVEEPSFIFIYFFSKRENIDSDDVEDAINDVLGEKGEVTGAGSGASGSNLDVQVYGNPLDFLDMMRSVLRELEVPVDTVVAIGEEDFPVFESNAE